MSAPDFSRRPDEPAMRWAVRLTGEHPERMTAPMLQTWQWAMDAARTALLDEAADVKPE